MNRHYTVSFIISASLPVVGLLLAWALGRKWEQWFPSEDSAADLVENWRGAVHGQITGLCMWTMALMTAIKIG